MGFLREHMATKEDIAFIRGDIKSINERLDTQEESVGQVITAVGNLAKLTKDYWEEMAVLRHKVERMEKWIAKVSVSTGVPYEV